MNLNHNNHNHFSFDLWATLIKSNSEFKKGRNLLFKDFFEINLPIQKITETVRNYDLLCNNINEKTGLNLDTFEIYLLILNALNVNIETIDTQKLNQFYLENDLLLFKYKPVLIYPKINLLFENIVNQNKTINILSNTGFIKGSSLRKILEYYGLENFFSFQIYSDETGFSKPNPEIFNIVFNEIQKTKKIQKNEVLHIGDNPIADYNGAIQFGFDAILIKN